MSSASDPPDNPTDNGSGSNHDRFHRHRHRASQRCERAVGYNAASTAAPTASQAELPIIITTNLELEPKTLVLSSELEAITESLLHFLVNIPARLGKLNARNGDMEPPWCGAKLVFKNVELGEAAMAYVAGFVSWLAKHSDSPCAKRAKVDYHPERARLEVLIPHHRHDAIAFQAACGIRDALREYPEFVWGEREDSDVLGTMKVFAPPTRLGSTRAMYSPYSTVFLKLNGMDQPRTIRIEVTTPQRSAETYLKAQHMLRSSPRVAFCVIIELEKRSTDRSRNLSNWEKLDPTTEFNSVFREGNKLNKFLKHALSERPSIPSELQILSLHGRHPRHPTLAPPTLSFPELYFPSAKYPGSPPPLSSEDLPPISGVNIFHRATVTVLRSDRYPINDAPVVVPIVDRLEIFPTAAKDGDDGSSASKWWFTSRDLMWPSAKVQWSPYPNKIEIGLAFLKEVVKKFGRERTGAADKNSAGDEEEGEERLVEGEDAEDEMDDVEEQFFGAMRRHILTTQELLEQRARLAMLQGELGELGEELGELRDRVEL